MVELDQYLTKRGLRIREAWRARLRKRAAASGRVVTRERGVIPGCRPAGPDGHMAVDRRGVPWAQVGRGEGGA